MKKTFLFSLLIIISKICLSQKDIESYKKLTSETQLSIVDSKSYIPNMKFRYFLSSNSAIRTTINYEANSSKIEINEVNGEGVGTVEKKNNIITFGLGYEKHFREDRVSPYFGAEIEIKSGNKNIFGSRTDSVDFIPNQNYTSKTPISGYGFHFFTGVDVDIYKKLYIGTELGLRYLYLKEKRGEFNVKDASSLTTPDVTTSLPATTKTSFRLINIGIIRLGWRF